MAQLKDSLVMKNIFLHFLILFHNCICSCTLETYLKDPIVTRKGLIVNVKLRAPYTHAFAFSNLISFFLISFIFFINGSSQAYNFNTLIPFKISLINFNLASLAANCCVSSFSTNFPPIRFKGIKITKPIDPIRAATPNSLKGEKSSESNRVESYQCLSNLDYFMNISAWSW